jgi:hypothetical protein
MSIYQRGETYVHRITTRDRTGKKITPTTIKENIYDQCGHWLVHSLPMTVDTVGEYYYNYALSSAATYGRYSSKVTATDAAGNISIFRDEFYVLPWDGVQDVRQTMGLPEAKSVDDDTIANSLWNSYLYALKDMYLHHVNETPSCNPDTGAGFDGSNTKFKTPCYPVADVNGDGTVSNSCPSDIYVTWKNSVGSMTYGNVTVDNADFGEIHLYQKNGTAIPEDNQGVYINYWTEPEGYDEYLFQQAAVRLACYELSKRFNSLNEITLQDIRSNNALVIIDPALWMKEYKRYLRTNRGIIMGGV